MKELIEDLKSALSEGVLIKKVFDSPLHSKYDPCSIFVIKSDPKLLMQAEKYEWVRCHLEKYPEVRKVGFHDRGDIDSLDITRYLILGFHSEDCSIELDSEIPTTIVLDSYSHV